MPFRYRVGNAQALHDRDRAVFRVAAAADQRADPLPDAPRPGVGGRHDLAADFQARNVGGAGRRRILAQPLHDVGPVDARGGHADEDFTGARRGHRTGDEPQDVRAARQGDLDRAHRRWNHRIEALGPRTTLHRSLDVRRSRDASRARRARPIRSRELARSLAARGAHGRNSRIRLVHLADLDAVVVVAHTLVRMSIRRTRREPRGGRSRVRVRQASSIRRIRAARASSTNTVTTIGSAPAASNVVATRHADGAGVRRDEERRVPAGPAEDRAVRRALRPRAVRSFDGSATAGSRRYQSGASQRRGERADERFPPVFASPPAPQERRAVLRPGRVGHRHDAVPVPAASGIPTARRASRRPRVNAARRRGTAAARANAAARPEREERIDVDETAMAVAGAELPVPPARDDVGVRR